MAAGLWKTRTAVESDYEQWSELYHGYRAFYKQERSEEVARTVWSWIQDPKHTMQAVVAVKATSTETSGEEVEVLGGFAHHQQWPRPLLGTTLLYLDDLFTRPDLRGQGIATLLLDALAVIGKQQGSDSMRWNTAHDNTIARRLYDCVGAPTGAITYDKPILQSNVICTTSAVAPPKNDLTVAPPKNHDLTVAPPKNDLTVAPPKNDLTVAPSKNGLTVAEPKNGLTVAEPKNGLTTVAEPKNGLTVAEPKNGLTVAEPKNGFTVAEPKNGLTVASLDIEE